MKYSLTRKQRKLLNYLVDCGDECPSYGEMAVFMEIKSNGGINRYIKALEQRGYIARLPGCSRSITVLK